MTDLELLHLLRQADSYSRRLVHQRREEHDGTDGNGEVHGYARLLGILDDHGEMSQRELADRLGIRPQSLTVALATLEREGYIQRRVSPSDKRQTLVCITPLGSRRRQTLQAIRQAAAQELLAPLSDGEKQQLSLLLERILSGAAR